MRTGLRLGALGLGALAAVACGDAPLHGPCERASDCDPPADGCYELAYVRSDGSEATGRTCSHECTADVDCPHGRCLALEGDPTETYLCFAACAEPMDCFEGHACTPSAVGSLCLPVE